MGWANIVGDFFTNSSGHPATGQCYFVNSFAKIDKITLETGVLQDQKKDWGT
jgi:hypothetical protein